MTNSVLDELDISEVLDNDGIIQDIDESCDTADDIMCSDDEELMAVLVTDPAYMDGIGDTSDIDDE